jgi:hypothetical protein
MLSIHYFSDIFLEYFDKSKVSIVLGISLINFKFEITQPQLEASLGGSRLNLTKEITFKFIFIHKFCFMQSFGFSSVVFSRKDQYTLLTGSRRLLGCFLVRIQVSLRLETR